MAQFPNRNLNQTCVYWGTPVDNGYGGFTYADPVELSCRWDDTTEIIKDAKGEEVVSNAKVQVSQDVDENGLMFLGDLDDLDSSEEEDPTTVANAYKILKFDSIPTIKGSRFFRLAYL